MQKRAKSQMKAINKDQPPFFINDIWKKRNKSQADKVFQ